MRQRAQLLFDILDQRPQPRLTGDHLRPAQPTHTQRHRVFGGKPAHRARQVHLRTQLLVAPMALDVDADRLGPVADKLGHRQPQRDQQDVLDPGMKRRGHLTEQQPAGLGIQ